MRNERTTSGESCAPPPETFMLKVNTQDLLCNIKLLQEEGRGRRICFNLICVIQLSAKTLCYLWSLLREIVNYCP